MNLQDHLFTVSELNQVIKSVLEESFTSISIEGELSNFRPASSGHWYFSLKDNSSTISGVIFKNNALYVNFKPKDGMKVKAKGKLSLYPQRGTYQIICTELKLFGEGDILQLIEDRKRKLAAQGLFDPSKKKSIPKFPKCIAIITSHTGAALQDILIVLKRRHSLSDIIILPTLVQGNDADKTITKQINKANLLKNCDLIILARGGGSVEDLLPFSEENVIYAIHKSEIPIITGIGHEIDTTLSDLAADIRAATPSAAAEIASFTYDNLFNTLQSEENRLIEGVYNKIYQIKMKLKTFNLSNVNRFLNSQLENRVIHIDNLKKELSYLILNKVQQKSIQINKHKDSLNDLSPLKLFEKGYSWVTINGKSIIDQELSVGDILDINYKNGKIKSKILEKKNEF